jgi:hypothetical protein
MADIDELWIGEIPPQSLARVEEALASFRLSVSVSRKSNAPLLQAHSVTALSTSDRAVLASSLARVGFPFELLHLGIDSERYAYLPGLGIHRVALNEVGEELLSYGQIEEILSASGGSIREFRKLLLRAIAEPWTNAIELIRGGEELRVA